MHALNTGEAPQHNGGTVASEERSALLGAPIALYEPQTGGDDMDPSDATQQLLTSLGRFQRELTNAVDESYQGWAEECMNQLIDCVEVALPRGWSEMVEALTDTGRILQTYENAGRPNGCVDFLNDAYELLCLMVGDLIVDSVRPTVMTQWRARYDKAVASLEQDGLVLIADDGETPTPPQVVQFTGRSSSAPAEPMQDSPFEMPDENTTAIAAEDVLPTLDELPPLETILDGASAKSPVVTVAEEVEAAQETAPSRHASPSRLVVEILDQLCEQLSVIETGEPEAGSYALDRFTGGVRALEREARDEEHELAVELCGLMLRAARLAKSPQGGFRSGLAELGYAFCGAYMEGFREDDLESVSDWRVECKGMLSEWESQDEHAATAVAAQPETQISDHSSDQLHDDASAAIAEEVEVVEEAPVVVDAISTLSEPEVSTVAEADPGADTEENAVDETTSAGLLEAAQRAALKGDAAGAKRYALQAAGAIARDEVKAAEHALRQTKERLKSGLESMREARNYVGETESAVQEIAESVKEGEIALGKARENSARIAQQLSDLREGVADIERQIAELQERREQELEKVAQTDAELADASRHVSDTDSELAERRAAEAAARTDLETRRQAVNDLQRTTGEIETEVEGASTLLDEKQKSFDDITDAIRHICGDTETKPREEGLLF